MNPSSISHAAGVIARTVISTTDSVVSSSVSYTASSVFTASGLRINLTVISVTSASVPSDPTNRPHRSYPGVSMLFPPMRTISPSGKTSLKARHVIGRHSIGERVRTAGIFRDVSADRARFLAGRIGRKIQAQVLDRAGQVQIHDARLNNRAKIGRIDFEDAVHAREDHHDAAVARNGPAGKARASAAAHDWSLEAIGEANDPGYVARAGWEDDAPGEPYLHRAVVFVQH